MRTPETATTLIRRDLAHLFPASMPLASTRARLWIETVGLGLLTCGMLACTGATAGSPATPQAETSSTAAPQQTYEGMIADSRCGAKHSAAIGKTASDCTRACVHAGAQFVLVDGDAIYLLEGNLAALKQVAGQRVKLVGSLNGNRISVSSVVPA